MGERVLKERFVVIAMGLKLFADELRRQGVEVLEVEWSPPHELEEDIKRILDRVL